MLSINLFLKDFATLISSETDLKAYDIKGVAGYTDQSVPFDPDDFNNFIYRVSPSPGSSQILFYEDGVNYKKGENILYGLSYLFNVKLEIDSSIGIESKIQLRNKFLSNINKTILELRLGDWGDGYEITLDNTTNIYDVLYETSSKTNIIAYCTFKDLFQERDGTFQDFFP